MLPGPGFFRLRSVNLSSMHTSSFILCGDLFEEISLIFSLLFFFLLQCLIQDWAHSRYLGKLCSECTSLRATGVWAGTEVSSLSLMWWLLIILWAYPQLCISTKPSFTTHKNILAIGECAHRYLRVHPTVLKCWLSPLLPLKLALHLPFPSARHAVHRHTPSGSDTCANIDSLYTCVLHTHTHTHTHLHLLQMPLKLGLRNRKHLATWPVWL